MTSPLLAEAVNGTAIAATSWDLPELNVAGDNVLLVAAIMVRPIRTIVPPAGWTLIATKDFTGGAGDRISWYRKSVPTAAGPYSDTFAVSGGSAQWGAAQLAFRATGAQPTNAAVEQTVFTCDDFQSRDATLPSAPPAGAVVLGFSKANGCGPSGYVYSGSATFDWSPGFTELGLVVIPASFPRMGYAWRLADGTATDETVDATWDQDNTRELTTMIVEVAVDPAPAPVDAIGWDVFDAADLNGPIIATLEDAKGRWFHDLLNGVGEGGFVINRHAAEATEAVLAEGNLVRIHIPECGAGYQYGIFLGPDGDYTLLATRGEQGAEQLNLRGLGLLSYLDRARMTPCAYSLDSITETWTSIWTKSFTNPTGVAIMAGEAGYVYVIGGSSKRIYKIRQSDRVVVRTSPQLFTGYAAGLSDDPADSSIFWALEAPWVIGQAGNTKIRKVRKSDWAILATFNLGSAIKHTDIRADGTHLWLSRYDGSTTIYKRSKTTGSVVNSYSVSYNGTTQLKANGISSNGTELAYWFQGTERALIVDSSAPTTVLRAIKTTDIRSFGGEWTTEGGDDFFYMVSSDLDRIWKYQLTDAGPACADAGGVFHPEQTSPGALAWRVLVEITHPDRPNQPVPDLTYDFTETNDSDGNPWPARTSTEEFTWQVGDRAYSDVLARLIPAGVIFRMDPNALVLHAYDAAAYGTDRTSPSFASGKVRFEGGENTPANGDLRRRDNRGQPDTYLIVAGDKGEYGYATLAGRYNREGFLRAGGVSDEAVLEAMGDDELGRQRLIADAIGFETLWADDEAGGRYVPYLRYVPGDLVTLATGTGDWEYDDADFQVHGVLVSERDGGWRHAPDLGSVYKVGSGPASSGGAGASSGGGAAGGTTVIDRPDPITLRKEGEAGQSGLVFESPDVETYDAGGGVVGFRVIPSDDGSGDEDEGPEANEPLVGDLANPPTQAQLEALIGAPAAELPGQLYMLRDEDTNLPYAALSDGVTWLYLPLVQTASDLQALATAAGTTNGYHSMHSAFAHDATSGLLFGCYMNSSGDAVAGAWDESGAMVQGPTVLHAALSPGDSHGVPVLLVRSSDRKVLVGYSAHNGAQLYYRLSSAAADVSAFAAEVNIDSSVGGTDYTYSMIHELEDGIYWFVRRYTGAAPPTAHADAAWSYTRSTDGGATWAAEVVLFVEPSHGGYWMVDKTASDRVDFLCVDQSTFDEAGGSAFHFYMIDTVLYLTDGTPITAGLPLEASDMTEVWASDGTQRAAPYGSIALDEDGWPRVVFTEFETVSPEDAVYLYAVFDGSSWTTEEIAAAGSGSLCASACLEPGTYNVAWYTKDVAGVAQVFRATRLADATWVHEQITDDTDEHALLFPIVGGKVGWQQEPGGWARNAAVAASFSIAGFVGAEGAQYQRVVGLDGEPGDALGEFVFRRGSDGTWYASRDGGTTWEAMGAPLSDATPLADSGAGDPGVGALASRDDHVHPFTAAGQHILLADGHATPFVFTDLLQMDDGTDFMWSDPE